MSRPHAMVVRAIVKLVRYSRRGEEMDGGSEDASCAPSGGGGA